MSSIKSIIKIFLLILIINYVQSQREEKVSDVDLNKAVSCLHVLSKKFDYEIDQKVYSSTMLACFTSLTELDAKEILVAVQQEMKFLSPEEIDKLCDVNNLKNIDKETLTIEDLSDNSQKDILNTNCNKNEKEKEGILDIKEKDEKINDDNKETIKDIDIEKEDIKEENNNYNQYIKSFSV